MSEEKKEVEEKKEAKVYTNAELLKQQREFPSSEPLSAAEAIAGTNNRLASVEAKVDEALELLRALAEKRGPGRPPAQGGGAGVAT